MLNTPPRIAPTASPRRPRTIARRSSGRPTISPTAKNMPSDSTITTIITRHMVAMDAHSNRGRPNWNGMTRPARGAAATPAKLILPRAAATTQPATTPSSTAVLLSSPVVKRVRASTTSRVNRATAR